MTKPFEHGFEKGGEAAMWTSVNFLGKLESEYKNLHEASEQGEEDKELATAHALLTLHLAHSLLRLRVFARTTQKGPVAGSWRYTATQ